MEHPSHTSESTSQTEPRLIGDILAEGVIGRTAISRETEVRDADLQSEVAGLKEEVDSIREQMAAGEQLDQEYVDGLKHAHLDAKGQQSQNQTG